MIHYLGFKLIGNNAQNSNTCMFCFMALELKLLLNIVDIQLTLNALSNLKDKMKIGIFGGTPNTSTEHIKKQGKMPFIYNHKGRLGVLSSKSASQRYTVSCLWIWLKNVFIEGATDYTLISDQYGRVYHGITKKLDDVLTESS